MVIVAIDAHQPSTIDLRVEHLGSLKIRRNQDAGLQAQPRRLCRNRIRQIARRRAAHHIESKGLRIGQRHGDDAILEAEAWKADSIILDVKIRCANPFAKHLCTHQRRKTYRQIGLKAPWNREKIAVAPDADRSSGDALARYAATQAVQIVLNFQRSKAVIAG